MFQPNQSMPWEIAGIAVCLVVACAAYIILFVKQDPVKPHEARAGGTSYVPSFPEPDSNIAQDQESEWIRDAKLLVSEMGFDKSNEIASASGLDTEWDFWGGKAQFTEMNDKIAYFLYARPYKVTVKGTRLSQPMLITYRCWGEKIQCEMLRHGPMKFKR